MNDRSRTKKRCQEAIIFHRCSSDFHRLSGRFSCRPREETTLSKSVGHSFFMVGKAYQEPGASDYIEDILLQRDYIID